MATSPVFPAQESADDHAVAWPQQADTRMVFLLDARDRHEARLMQAWIERTRADKPSAAVFIRLRTRQTRARLSTEALALEDPAPGPAVGPGSLWLQPLRIVWLPGRRRGNGLLQDLFHGFVTQPGPIRRRWLAHRHPERLQVISGDGAWGKDMLARFLQRGDRVSGNQTFVSFLQDQAMLVLERAERLARGARYKIARLLPQEVFAEQGFQRMLAAQSVALNLPLGRVRSRAERYLREMAASQTPFTLDLLTSLYRAAVRSNHEPGIDVSQEQLGVVSSLIANRPVVFVISHKSMLDTVALSLVLFDADLPLPLTLGGINLSTPGIGAFARRAGIIFLRRSFQDNEVYKGTFRRYIDYLIEKRFAILWALEGTRSRTGKLLPPRYGLFNYVVESILRTGLHDLAFVPVSVTYDQITEVEDYATEQRGQSKKAEGMGWMLRFFKPGKSHGQIFVRFGEPVSLPALVGATPLESPMPEPARAATVQALAARIAMHMNRATPITATAILTLILLASGRRAQTLAEIKLLARSAAILVRKRRIETVGRMNFRDDKAVKATLAQLHDTGIVSYFDEGLERLYDIQPEQHHKAAYYRNTAIHHFVIDAFAEIALLQAARVGGGRATEAFCQAGESLRDLFQFEFYFDQPALFEAELTRAADDRFKDWANQLLAGPGAVQTLLADVRPLVAHGVLRSFVDAYRVLASALVIAGSAPAKEKPEFLADVLRLGRQALQLTEVSSPESVSKALYETAYKLAQSRDLLTGERLAERQALESQLHEVTDCLDQILALANRWRRLLTA